MSSGVQSCLKSLLSRYDWSELRPEVSTKVLHQLTCPSDLGSCDAYSVMDWLGAVDAGIRWPNKKKKKKNNTQDMSWIKPEQNPVVPAAAALAPLPASCPPTPVLDPRGWRRQPSASRLAASCCPTTSKSSSWKSGDLYDLTDPSFLFDPSKGHEILSFIFLLFKCDITSSWIL